MTPLFATALTGFFVFSGIGGVAVDPLGKTEAVQVPTYPKMSVSMTAYNAVPEQTDSDPYTTASGAYSDTDIVAARSVDLADELPFGTVIMVTSTGTSTPNCGAKVVEEQIGLRVIADSMHPRKRNQIDILLDHEDKVKVGGKLINPARAFGVCKNIEIAIVGRVTIKNIPKTQAELKAMLAAQKEESDTLAINR